MLPLRRYAPALMVAAALLLLVIVAPSRGTSNNVVLGQTGSTSTGLPTGTTGAGATGTTGAGATSTGGTGAGATTGNGSVAGGATTGSSGTNTTGNGGTTSGGSGGKTAAAGSTKHCVGGKNFAVAGFDAAPPCQPTYSGNNGGATTRGVTAKQVEVVFYQPEQSLALKAILGPSGLYPSDAQIEDFLQRSQTFMNARWQFWGRQLHIDYYASQSCQASPPSDACFRQDAQTIVSKYHPFAVIYPRDLTAPGFNQELSQLGVVNFGSSGAPLSFDTSQQPYHWDYDMDGDMQSELFGEFYCKELAGRPASLAGTAALRTKIRTAEILVDDTPQHVQAAQHLQAVIDQCDPSHGAVIKSFSPNTGQAVSEATTVASQAKQSGITTLIYYTDPVAPVYFTPQLTEQNYYPENVLVGAEYLDFDVVGQLYSGSQWKDAFGLGDLPDMGPISVYDASAVYRNTKGTQSEFVSADNFQSYLSEVAYGVQQAGPNLTPSTFQQAMLSMKGWGGDRYHPTTKFGPGDYTGVNDARIIYWDPNKVSPVNGKKGTYVSLYNGRRFALGQIPKHAFSR